MSIIARFLMGHLLSFCWPEKNPHVCFCLCFHTDITILSIFLPLFFFWVNSQALPVSGVLWSSADSTCCGWSPSSMNSYDIHFHQKFQDDAVKARFLIPFTRFLARKFAEWIIPQTNPSMGQIIWYQYQSEIRCHPRGGFRSFSFAA